MASNPYPCTINVLIFTYNNAWLNIAEGVHKCLDTWSLLKLDYNALPKITYRCKTSIWKGTPCLMSPGSLAHTVPLRAGLLGSLVVYQVVRVCRIRELDGEHVRKWQEKRESQQETLFILILVLLHVHWVLYTFQTVHCLHTLSL